MQFEVDRTDPTRTRTVEDRRDLAPGEARLTVERFGLSANNVSYHALGDVMGYWKLFPSPDAGTEWRRIPVWGFATVTGSADDALPVGGRYFGMYPMGDELVVRPTDVRDGSFRDGAEHRQDVMAPVWNQYTVLPGDDASEGATRSWDVVMRPLAVTGFLVGDHLEQHGCFGADTVVLTSASSKTALLSAFFVRALGGPRVVGLTSPGNRSFVEGTDAFDQVLPYDEVGRLAGDGVVLLDYAGNVEVRSAVADTCGAALVKHFAMGLAQAPDLGQLMDTASLPGPAPEMFPAQLAVSARRRELGGPEYDRRTAEAMASARSWTEGWLTLVEGHGTEAVAEVYRRLVEGGAPPDAGHVLLPD